MKIMKKIIAGLFVITIISMISLNITQAVSAPNSITVNRAIALNDIVENHDHSFVIFTASDGKVIYCMDIDKEALKSGQTATLSGTGDAGLLYILRNGYPNKKIKGIPTVDMYITQAAVWWYLDEGKISDSFKNATKTDVYDAIPAIKSLVNAARSARDNQVTPSMNVTNGSTKFALTSDGKYYESDYMSANLTGTNQYTVSVENGTKSLTVIDESGNVGNTLNSGERFKVRIPVSEATSNLNVTVKFAATGTTEKAKIYKPADVSYQRVVGLYDEVTNLSKSVNLTLTPILKCSVVDGKYYGKDGKEVDKATYTKECQKTCEYSDGKYYGKNGNEVDKDTYAEECTKLCEYSDGKYYGKDGTEVTEKQFNKECKTLLICTIANDNYYGKDGKVVGKETYEKECGSVHICEFTDNAYYGANGAQVDENTFNQECGSEVVVPNTSSNVSPLSVTSGIIMFAAGAYVIIARKKKLA